MLAMSPMDPTIQGLFFLAAVICFALSFIAFSWGRYNLIGLGLALFAFPFMWNAFAAS